MESREIIAEIKEEIVPNRLIYKKRSYVIKRVANKFKIKGIKIYFTQSGKLEKVIINGEHPNSNPETGEFCLPENLIFREADSMVLPTIESVLRTFNLDDCYFQPWEDFSYMEE